MILSTTVMVAVSTCSLVYLSSGQVFLPCLSLTSHQPFFSRIINTSQKGNLIFCLHHKWIIFGNWESKTELRFVFRIHNVEKEKISAAYLCWKLPPGISSDSVLWNIFQLYGEKSFSHLQNCKLSCLHFLGSIFLLLPLPSKRENCHILPQGKRIHHLNFKPIDKDGHKITEMLACTTELAEDKIRTLQAFRSGLLTFSPPALDDISWPSTSQSYFEFAHAKQHHSMQDPTFLQRTLGYILGLKRPTDVLKKNIILFALVWKIPK